MFKDKLVHEVLHNPGEETWYGVLIDIAEKYVPSVDGTRYLVSFIGNLSGHFSACNSKRKGESAELLKPVDF